MKVLTAPLTTAPLPLQEHKVQEYQLFFSKVRAALAIDDEDIRITELHRIEDTVRMRRLRLAHIRRVIREEEEKKFKKIWNLHPGIEKIKALLQYIAKDNEGVHRDEAIRECNKIALNCAKSFPPYISPDEIYYAIEPYGFTIIYDEVMMQIIERMMLSRK